MDLLSKLLKDMVANKASDLFLSTGSTPALRVHGKMHAYDGTPLGPGRTKQMAALIMNEEQMQAFEENREANIAHSVPGIGRFRFNLFFQRNEVAMVIRSIPDTIPKFEQLGIASPLQDIIMMKRGLVLVAGPSGAGKSTTLAAMIDYRNETELSHMVTVEDPIEYVIQHKKSIVNQREIGSDTTSYHNALINVLRQSPDVIMVGEIRERLIMEDVLEFADTGHLCLATIHANSASQALERILHMFPKDMQDKLCTSLANNLKAVVSQILVPSVFGDRAVALELLLNTPRTSDLIRRGQFDHLTEVMDKDTNSGMRTMDQSLFQLYCDDRISEETALAYATSVSNMRLQIRLSAPSAPEPVTT
ncbi:MAG: PilT/PilU family type 4a pilus ATPase [Gammaproteobacteria bacterium]|nr:PilT/PilU family type 4a pilus ATPase [Gammaproteobacteria bacterium]MDH5800909.1 PilT/PilU family type 4a pilus ATPase [Gammaproteobacteria bacterium]